VDTKQFAVVPLLMTLFMASPALRADDLCPRLPSVLERAIGDEMNQVRQDPPGYAMHLEDLVPLYQGTDRRISDHVFLTSKEGVSAVEEAIQALRHTSPRQSLAWDSCLSQSAADHAADNGPKGLIGHDNSNGENFAHRIHRYRPKERVVGENIQYGSETAREIVMDLIIDDGVPGRGHRRNMLDPQFHAAGVACGNHATMHIMCVMDFGG
jgi:uncharacterized protein YkwD